jgi:SPP1 gp7 family putative phage head morphogenesis protein
MARTAESSYNSRLRAVARQIDAIVRGYAPDGVIENENVTKALRWYAELLKPWATSVAKYMVADVARRNERAWRQNGDDLSRAIQSEILYAPTGQLFTGLMNDQVELITSLPLDAAKRVHEITTEAMSTTGVRAKAISEQILATGEVSASRARLIARTEVARTASSFTQARARFAGSLGYIWRTSKDSDVRPTHQKMNGVYVAWDKPPKTDASLDPYHAGCGPNCRCYPDPVLPDL